MGVREGTLQVWIHRGKNVVDSGIPSPHDIDALMVRLYSAWKRNARIRAAQTGDMIDEWITHLRSKPVEIWTIVEVRLLKDLESDAYDRDEVRDLRREFAELKARMGNG